MTTVTFKTTYTPESGLGVAAKTFSYTVSAYGSDDLTSNPKIFDGKGTMTVTDVAFTANDSSTEKTATISLPTGGTTTFPKAGIYRYKLTQTAFTAQEVEAGILTSAGNGAALTKILDLYVDKDGKIIDVVLSEAGAFTASGSNVNYTSKTDTFANTFGKPGTKDDDPDKPGDEDKATKHTITLDKQVTGNMGTQDSNVKFPFEITVTTSNTVLNGVQYSIGTKNDAVIGSTYSDVIKLAHGESIDIIVPNGVTVAIFLVVRVVGS